MVENDELLHGTGAGHFAGFFLRRRESGGHNVAARCDRWTNDHRAVCLPLPGRTLCRRTRRAHEQFDRATHHATVCRSPRNAWPQNSTPTSARNSEVIPGHDRAGPNQGLAFIVGSAIAVSTPSTKRFAAHLAARTQSSPSRPPQTSGRCISPICTDGCGADATR